MLKRLLFIFLITLFVANFAYGEEQGSFFHKFDIGMKLLQIEQKTGMVVVDSENCIYCKKLKSITFKDKNVINLLNRYYISIELNLDKNDTIHFKKHELTAQSFAAGLKIRGTPTMIFFDEKNDILTLLPGYLPPDKMLPILKYMGQRIFEEKIKFREYLKKPVERKFRGSEKPIFVSLEDVKFVAENDPFIEIYSFLDMGNKEKIKGLKQVDFIRFKEGVDKLSKNKKYLFIGKNKEELNSLGKKMLSLGFSTILIYNNSSNNQ